MNGLSQLGLLAWDAQSLKGSPAADAQSHVTLHGVYGTQFVPSE
jgi:hypothetical protein